MSEKIKVDELAKTILEYLEEFKDVTEEACQNGVLETADEAVRELRNAHPIGSEGQPAGKYGSWNEYNKGWTKRTQRKKKAGIEAVVWNQKHYRLTHLLEKGHAKRNGGRVEGTPHISKAEEYAVREIESEIRRKL